MSASAPRHQQEALSGSGPTAAASAPTGEQVALAEALLELGATVKLAALLTGLPVSRARALARSAERWQGYARPPMSGLRLFANRELAIQAALFWRCCRGARQRIPQYTGNIRAARVLLRAFAHYRHLSGLVPGEAIGFNDAYLLLGQLALGALKPAVCCCGAQYLRLSTQDARACPVCAQSLQTGVAAGAVRLMRTGLAMEEMSDALPSVKALAYDPVKGSIQMFNTLLIEHLRHLAQRQNGHAEQLLGCEAETVRILSAHDHARDSRYTAHERALFTVRWLPDQAERPAGTRELEHTGLLLLWASQFRQAARFDRNLACYIWGASEADSTALLGMHDNELPSRIKSEGWRLRPHYPHPVIAQLDGAQDDKAMRYAQARALLQA